jgi:hypothetical protein
MRTSTSGVDAAKGCLTPSSNRLPYLRFIFEFGSVIGGKAPSICLTAEGREQFDFVEGCLWNGRTTQISVFTLGVRYSLTVGPNYEWPYHNVIPTRGTHN